MLLMLKDIPVMEYDLEKQYIKIYRNDLLPFSMRDYIKDTDNATDWKSIAPSFYSIRDFLSGRILNISRSNAKIILKSANLPNALSTENRIKITEMCRGLSMSDAYWLKQKEEALTYNVVNLRKKSLSDASFPISILGTPLSVVRDILAPDIGTQGMFTKTWHRKENGIAELWKTDETKDKIFTQAEIQVSNILDATNISHVKYTPHFEHGVLLACCENIANDDISLISGQDYKDWCTHTNKNFIKEVCKINESLFAKMCVMDYLLANTDRHLENIALLMNNHTGIILDIAPLYDHNQALIADTIGTDIDKLFYDPTETDMLTAARTYFTKADLQINWEKLGKQNLLRFLEKPLQIKIKYENRTKDMQEEIEIDDDNNETR